VFSLKVCTLLVLAALALGFISLADGLPFCAVSDTATSLRAQSSLSEISAVGEKKLLYIRVCYPDDGAEPISFAAAESLMTEVSDFYRRHSYGQFWIAGTVTPLLTLPSPKANYFPIDEDGQQTWLAAIILADAREAARQAGYDPADYDLDMVRFNSPFIQSFANLGSRGAWMVSSHPATTIHEIGHNLGLHHANQWSGPLNGPGTNVEYGDDFDIMGNPSDWQLAGFHFMNKLALGWLGDSNSVRVSSSGVFRVQAHDTDTGPTGTYALRVRKDDERDYWIEKRQDFGDIFDHMLRSGLLTYWDSWSGSAGGTQIIDLLGTNESLPIGHPLVDPAAGVKVIPVEQASDMSYMDVAVILGQSKINLLGDWLQFTGEPGRTYSFQFSTDLRTWIEFARRSSASGEVFARVDRQNPRAFYRVVAAPDLM
jgi:hypothetical protein